MPKLPVPPVVESIRSLAGIYRRDRAQLPLPYAKDEAALSAYVLDQYERLRVDAQVACEKLGGGELPEVESAKDLAKVADAIERLTHRDDEPEASGGEEQRDGEPESGGDEQ